MNYNISVCMATYNGGRFITQQIESILLQLREGDEIVVSDDSSTDDTIARINMFRDQRIRLFPGQRFRNHLLNFEFAMLQARHEIIILSDQDDVWLPGKVDAVLDALNNYDLVNTDHSVVDEFGHEIMPSYFDVVPSKPGVLKNLLKCSYFGCCMAFHRYVFTAAYPIPPYVSSHDLWLGHVADIYFRVKFLPTVYTAYRKHENNVSSAANPISPYPLWKKIGFRIQIIRGTIKLILKNGWPTPSVRRRMRTHKQV